MRDFLTSCLQCGIAILCGAPVWFAAGLEREARLIGTLITGFGGLWLIMKAYAFVRFGRGAKANMD